MTVRDMPDNVLASLVRTSLYLRGVRFEEGEQRYIVLMAAPYGDINGVWTVKGAVMAFLRFLRAPDFRDRQVQVFDTLTGECFEMSVREAATCKR